jgi:hypothetical protein
MSVGQRRRTADADISELARIEHREAEG